MAERPTSETLLTAYVDGVGELEVEERRRVERFLAEPAMRAEHAATRDLLDQLRALPDETPSVDWAAMERAIHAEVGDEVPRRSWLFRWRFALPAFALAGAAAILFLVVRSQDGGDVSPITFVPNPVPDSKLPMFEQLDDRVTVYVDGTDLEIADTNELDDELAELELADHDVPAVDEASLGFLEPTDLAWIDDLDDDDLTRAEKALAQPIKLRKGI